jgi:hypothetical protein
MAGSPGTDEVAGLRFDSFAPGYDDAGTAADTRTANWFEAVKLGFHEQRADSKNLPGLVDGYLRL